MMPIPLKKGLHIFGWLVLACVAVLLLTLSLSQLNINLVDAQTLRDKIDNLTQPFLLIRLVIYSWLSFYYLPIRLHSQPRKKVTAYGVLACLAYELIFVQRGFF